MTEDSQFDQIIQWLQRQHGAVSQVRADQSSAEQLVSDAEAELGELRRVLAGVEPLGETLPGVFALAKTG